MPRGEQSIPLPFRNDCYVILTVQTPTSVRRGRSATAEKPAFWWLKQKEVYVPHITASPVWAVRANTMALFPPLPSVLGFYIHVCHFTVVNNSLHAPVRSPGLRCTFKVGSSLQRGERAKQLLKSKQAQKKVSASQSSPMFSKYLPHIPDKTQ